MCESDWALGGADVYKREPSSCWEFLCIRNGYYVTWPFALVVLNPKGIKLFTPLGWYSIDRNNILEVYFRRGVFLRGVQILHKQARTPEFILFLSFLNRLLLMRFHRLGYPTRV